MRTAALFLVLSLAHLCAVDGGTTVSVVNGMIGNRHVGTFSSQLQRILDTMFAPVDITNWENTSLVNSSLLRYLFLQGDYQADAPLLIPSLLILKLRGSLRPAANLSLAPVPRFTGLVTLNHTSFSGVIGGTFDASGLPAPSGGPEGYQAIAVQGGGHNTVRSVRAIANNSATAIGITASPYTEVSHCDVGGSAEMQSVGRCIWTLATTHALVHDNHVHHCSSHALDFDAYTSSSAAYSNLCEDCGEEGIFVEESASANMIFNNTCRRNRSGIGVYSNVVGPVANNMFIGNTVVDNAVGITAGGVGHNPKKQSQYNVFASNRAKANTVQYDPMHGAVHGDYWVDNTHDGAGFEPVPESSAAVSIFEP